MQATSAEVQRSRCPAPAPAVPWEVEAPIQTVSRVFPLRDDYPGSRARRTGGLPRLQAAATVRPPARTAGPPAPGCLAVVRTTADTVAASPREATARQSAAARCTGAVGMAAEGSLRAVAEGMAQVQAQGAGTLASGAGARCCEKDETNWVDIGRRRMKRTEDRRTAGRPPEGFGTRIDCRTTWQLRSCWCCEGEICVAGRRYREAELGAPALGQETNKSSHGLPVASSVLYTAPPRCRGREDVVSDRADYG